MDKGYLYIATGSKFIEEALTSIRSLKKIDSSVHATLVTDKEVNHAEFDNVIIQNIDKVNTTNWKEGIMFKVMGLLKSPYNKTFFIDTDTYFADDCSELFDLLNHFDLLMAHAPADTAQVVIDEKKVAGYYSYNTGVMVFNNNEKIRELFNEWLRVYNEKIDVYPHDQTPFMEALMNKNIKLYVMQAIYNFRFPYLVTVPGLKVKLFHGRSNNFHALANKVNKKIKHRSWSPVSGLVYERVSTKAYLIGLIPKGVYSKYQQFKRLIGR